MSDSSRFIDGIYNYCDRWCERCAFTARCRLFADEQAFREAMERRSDEQNAKFWDRFNDLAGDVGDDDETPFDFKDEVFLPEVDPADAAGHERRRDRAKSDPLVKLAHAYAMQVHAWLRGHEQDLPSEEDRFRARRDAITPAEALEVIAWHPFQIHVKLARAALGRLDAEAEAEAEEAWDTGAAWRDDDDLQAIHLSDANGSAKVALLGIERSIGAWTLLRDAYSRQDAQIQDFQRQLARMRRLLVAAFPDARSFHRPGLDD